MFVRHSKAYLKGYLRYKTITSQNATNIGLLYKAKHHPNKRCLLALYYSQTWKNFLVSKNMQYSLHIIRPNSNIQGTFSEKIKYLIFTDLIYWIMLCLYIRFQLKLFPRSSKDHLILIPLIFQNVVTRYLPTT